MFYVVLAALFAICMQGLLATLDDREPKYKLESSLIGSNPGLGFRPISKRTEEGSLIWYDVKNNATKDKWVNLLHEFLALYEQDHKGKNTEQCQFGEPPKPGNVCQVDLTKFGPCSPQNSYGYYNASQPCVFLKLNKIYGWVPEYYTTPQEGMPVELTQTIIDNAAKNETHVWISCEGHSPVDKEHVKKFLYQPSKGFASYYFPYTNTENYLSPVVAVQILDPTPNVIISIECRAWAKNINYRGGDLQREGSINFEILIDDK